MVPRGAQAGIGVSRRLRPSARRCAANLFISAFGRLSRTSATARAPPRRLCSDVDDDDAGEVDAREITTSHSAATISDLPAGVALPKACCTSAIVIFPRAQWAATFSMCGSLRYQSRRFYLRCHGPWRAVSPSDRHSAGFGRRTDAAGRRSRPSACSNQPRSHGHPQTDRHSHVYDGVLSSGRFGPAEKSAMPMPGIPNLCWCIAAPDRSSS